MSIKELVKGTVKFKFYRKENFYYETESGFVFPVPISDTGDATFLPEDKGILFMRYIRKELKNRSEEK